MSGSRTLRSALPTTQLPSLPRRGSPSMKTACERLRLMGWDNTHLAFSWPISLACPVLLSFCGLRGSSGQITRMKNERT